MRSLFHIVILFFLLPSLACTQAVNDELRYLRQKTPTLEPEIFAPGVISKVDEYEYGSVFNKDGTAFYYGVDVGGRSEIRFTRLVDESWSTPEIILSHEKYGFNDPFLSPDENRLYFISERTIDGTGAKQDHDIWYVERDGKKWSEPINAGPNINTGNSEYYISFSENGTMYFSSNKKNSEAAQQSFDIYTSAFVNGEFQPAERLGDAVNTSHYEADVFIDPAEAYMIFCARRPEGLGRGDLYISFKNDDGTWTKSINMGNQINSKNHELCPFVSKDGKYFFYTSNKDIYWVSTKIFDGMRKQ